jgi:bifunctional DNA-binding transcriptional regulator/antitoxin component of YhaV-PrlF toxin-antitoxin module
MGLKPKTRLNVEVRGGEIVLHPVGVAKLRGIGKAMADGSDAVDYVRRLRNEWEHRR